MKWWLNDFTKRNWNVFNNFYLWTLYKQESDTLNLPTGLFSDTEDFDDMVGVKAVGENRVVDFCVGGGWM